jgi:murein DD-endopeptidase MepM/ murein hydrolase activator NlpD
VIRLIGCTTLAAAAVLGAVTAITGSVVAAVPVHGLWMQPLRSAVISQPFGCTSVALEPLDPACPQRHWHSGVDLAAARGTPVVAALAGVAQVILSAGGYGLHVIIDHGGGLSTLYAHLATVAVRSGGYVAAGEQIGTVGSTGNSTGPHLHFEVRRDGIAEDPRQDVVLP